MINPNDIIYNLSIMNEGIQHIVVAYYANLGLEVPTYLGHPLLLFIVLSSGPVSISLLGTFLTTGEILSLITYGVTFIISFH